MSSIDKTDKKVLAFYRERVPSRAWRAELVGLGNFRRLVAVAAALVVGVERER